MKVLKEFLRSFIILILFSFILCLAYPFSIYLISHIFFKNLANGSVIQKNGQPIGSQLLGQQFVSDHYFIGRPSIFSYDGIHSGSSNIGPTSKDLKDNVEKQVKEYLQKNNLSLSTKIPIDAITNSASGLDPHITVNNAKLQVDRIAKSRNTTTNNILLLIEKYTIHKTLLSRDRINLLEINLALDEIYPVNSSKTL